MTEYKEFKNLAAKIAALNPDVELQDHQKAPIPKFRSGVKGQVFPWDMGSGKTLGSIAAFEEGILPDNPNAKVLVATPATLKDNFLYNGVRKFTNSKGVIIGASGERGKDIVHIHNMPTDQTYYVVSNEMFRKDSDAIINKIKPDTLILDEAQKYRDPQSVNYKNLKDVRHKFNHAILLTGTPVSNHPHDVIPLIDIASDGKHELGNYEDFERNFIQTIKKKSGPFSFLGLGVDTEEKKLKNTGKLKTELNKYVSTFDGSGLNKPKKNLEEVEVPMSDEQFKVYKNVFHSKVDPLTRFKIENNLPVSDKDNAHMFRVLLNARQASNSLHLFDGSSIEEAADNTPKVKRLLDDLDEHLAADPKNKAILYSNFYHGGVDVLSAGLKKRGVSHGIYAGSGHTDLKQRSQDIDDYLSGKHRAIVINTAGAEGLNLPGTTAHLSLDGHFNPAMNLQAEARGIRVGSPVKEVLVRRYKSVLPRTPVEKLINHDIKILKDRRFGADQWVYSTAERKQQLNDQFYSLLQPEAPKETQVEKSASERAAHDHQLWKTWQDNPNPVTLAPLMDNLAPIINQEASKWKQSGISPLNLKLKAHNLAYEAVQTWKPESSQLNTHVTNHLRGMSRYVINTQNIVRVPEEHIYDYRRLMKAKEEFFMAHDREPDERELEELVTQGAKLKDFKPIIENFYSKASESNIAPAVDGISMNGVAAKLLYDKLKPNQQTIFSHTYGFNGAPILQNQQIAKQLGVSPAAVTKQKKTIMKTYNKYVSSVNGLIG